MLSAIALLTAHCAHAAEIKLVEASSAQFGDTETELHLEFSTDQNTDAVVRWLHTATPTRTLSRGEQAVRLTASRPSTAKIRLRIPKVRDGVIWATTLRVSLLQKGQDVASLEKALWIFPRDPFTGKRASIRNKRVALYDPRQSTAELFDEIELPHERIHNLSAMRGFDGGIILIGEGISLRREAGIADELVAAAKRGVRVICLAPSDGQVQFAAKPIFPTRIVLKQQDAITDLDKRFDTSYWPGIGSPPSTRFELHTNDNELILSVGDGHVAWPWIELSFQVNEDETRRSGITFCGFRVVQHWQNGPTPRYLLERLINTPAVVDVRKAEKLK